MYVKHLALAQSMYSVIVCACARTPIIQLGQVAHGILGVLIFFGLGGGRAYDCGMEFEQK